jgi:sulfatase modifying factor 1
MQRRRDVPPFGPRPPGCSAAACALLVVVSGCALAPGGTDVVVNTLGMTLVRIPAGRFTMGSALSLEALQPLYPQVEARRLADLEDEAPAHEVQITRAFYMARYELTVGQFEAFLQRSGHVPESIADGTGGYGYNPAYDPGTSARGDAFEGRDPRYSWRNPGFAQTPEHPVVNVTWHDA